MGDGGFRAFERELISRPGGLGEYLLDAVGRLEDPELIAQLTDRLSHKLTVPAGNILILSTDPPAFTVPPGETHALPVMVPLFEGFRGKVFCFRLMISSSRLISWGLGPREGSRGGHSIGPSEGTWPKGHMTIPFAQDPFELRQASVWDFEVENLDVDPADVSLSMICRHQYTECECCEGWTMIGRDGSLRPALGTENAMPCPSCQPEAHEQDRFHRHLVAMEERAERRA